MEKTTKQKIIDRGLTPRQIIFDVIDLLISDRSKNHEKKDKQNKIILWHVALADLSTDQIRVGMIKISRSKNEFIPDSGSFYEMCNKSNPAKQYISQSEPDPIPLCNRDLNGQSCKMIIDKLKLPERLKQNEFKSFKENRHIIEADRKSKLLKRKNATI